MNWCRSIGLTLLLGTTLAACNEDRSDTFTLYRNSPLDHSMRVHWATFDATDGNNYNMNNCMMAARILNANVSASAAAEGKARDSKLGFWCESGAFREKGAVPANFPEAFPSDSPDGYGGAAHDDVSQAQNEAVLAPEESKITNPEQEFQKFLSDDSAFSEHSVKEVYQGAAKLPTDTRFWRTANYLIERGPLTRSEMSTFKPDMDGNKTLLGVPCGTYCMGYLVMNLENGTSEPFNPPGSDDILYVEYDTRPDSSLVKALMDVDGKKCIAQNYVWRNGDISKFGPEIAIPIRDGTCPSFEQ